LLAEGLTYQRFQLEKVDFEQHKPKFPAAKRKKLIRTLNNASPVQQKEFAGFETSLLAE